MPMVRTAPIALLAPAHAREGVRFLPRRAGMTIVEVMVALGVTGLLLAMIMSQMVESATIGLRSTKSLEHSRNTRELITRMADDTRNAQTLVLYREFADRATPRRDGETGNYFVVHRLNSAGLITRTVGYYAIPASGSGWILYRHDSADGLLAPGLLPPAGTAGSHRTILRAVNLPNANHLFRCVRDRAVLLRGEFGTAGANTIGKSEFIQTVLATRS